MNFEFSFQSDFVELLSSGEWRGGRGGEGESWFLKGPLHFLGGRRRGRRIAPATKEEREGKKKKALGEDNNNRRRRRRRLCHEAQTVWE